MGGVLRAKFIDLVIETTWAESCVLSSQTCFIRTRTLLLDEFLALHQWCTLLCERTFTKSHSVDNYIMP